MVELRIRIHRIGEGNREGKSEMKYKREVYVINLPFMKRLTNAYN